MVRVSLPLMDCAAEDFHKNQLSIITYNYDRSIEQFLYISLQNSYGLRDDQTAALVRRIDIVHVYGKLGNLPWLEGDGRPYDPAVSLRHIKMCTDAMLIIEEGQETSDEFQSARALLQGAELICFLGFGYLETNLVRLFGRDPESGALRVPQQSHVCGSAYGMGREQEVEVLRLMNQPGEHQYDPETGVILGYPLLGSSGEKSLEFLREHVVFPVGTLGPRVIP